MGCGGCNPPYIYCPLFFALDTMPNWLISIVLLVLAIWKIRGELKYRNQQLFLAEVGGDWIDKTKLPKAIRSYLYLQITFFVFLPIFAILTYVKTLHPYLWHIVLGFLGLWFGAVVCWFKYYFAKE